jgi:hypothetical protein
VRAVALTGALYAAVSLIAHPRVTIMRDPFAPLVALKTLMIPGFFLNILMLGGTRRDLTPDTLLLVGIVGVLSILLADVLALGMPLREDPSNAARLHSGPPTASRVFTAVYVLGWAWRLYAVQHGLLYGTLLATAMGVTAYSNILGALGQLSSVAYFGLLAFSRSPGRLLWLLPAEIAWKWIGSSKVGAAYVIVPVLLVLASRQLFRQRRHWVLVVSGLAVVSAPSFALVHQYRVEAQRIILRDGFAAFSPWAAAREVRPRISAAGEELERMTARLSWAEGLATIWESRSVRERDFWFGDSYARAVAWLVPRAVWPEKPGVSLGLWYAEEFLGWRHRTRAEAEITIWGEAFLNFGLAGAVLLPGIWLVLLQAAYVRALRWRSWGVFVIACAYVPMLNSLAVNLGVSVAAIGQALALSLVMSLGVRTLGGRGKRVHTAVGSGA